MSYTAGDLVELNDGVIIAITGRSIQTAMFDHGPEAHWHALVVCSTSTRRPKGLSFTISEQDLDKGGPVMVKSIYENDL